MELPFKYIVLYIIKILNNRNLDLCINKDTLIKFNNEIIKKLYFIIEDKQELLENFNIEYELEDLFNKYWRYFDRENENIIFDRDYICELDSLLDEQKREEDPVIINGIECIIELNTVFLEIVGVNLNKGIYNFLLDLDKKIEESYNELSDLDNYVGLNEINTRDLTERIKKLIFKRMILLINTKNLLSSVEYKDLAKYSNEISEKSDDYDDLALLLYDGCFDESTIICDVFQKSIFTSNDLYYSTLKERLNMNILKESRNLKYSKIKFYLTYLELLEEEIKKDNNMCSELIIIKYRLMQVIDTMFDTALFTNNDILKGIDFKENYSFIEYEIYYFIKELLMYDDERYRNKEFDTENIIVYIDGIVKKLLIKTYYKLTGDKKIIEAIKNNKLYGVNSISSSLLKDIVEKPKTKIKDM